MKHCNTCGVQKPLEAFPPNKKLYDGYEARCKDCKNAIARAKRAEKSGQLSQDDADKSKPCTVCNVVKPYTEFGLASGTKDGRNTQCKDCRNTAKRIYVAKQKGISDEEIKNIEEEFRTLKVENPPASVATDIPIATGAGIVEITKACNRCGVVKRQSDYPFSNKPLGIYSGVCKSCKNNRSKEYYKENKETITAKHKEYNEKNKERIQQWNRLWTAKNRDYLNNKERERRKNDIAFRLEKDLRRTMNKFYDKEGRTFDYIGCTREQLLDWFDFQSNIDNVDTTTDFHIDHVVPCNAFNLTEVEQQRHCFHWSNLRLCSAKENLTKNGKIDIELINEQVEKVNYYIQERNLIDIDKTYLIKSR